MTENKSRRRTKEGFYLFFYLRFSLLWRVEPRFRGIQKIEDPWCPSEKLLEGLRWGEEDKNVALQPTCIPRRGKGSLTKMTIAKDSVGIIRKLHDGNERRLD